MNATNTAKPINDQLNALSKKRQLWILPVLVVIVVVGATVLVLVPQMRAINTGRQDLEVQEEQLNRLVEKRQQLESLSEAELDSQLLVVMRVLPNEKPVSQALGLLMNTTKSNEVNLNGYAMDPGEVASGGAKAEVKEDKDQPGVLASLLIETELTGIYGAMTSFLRIVEEEIAPLSRALRLTLSINEEKQERSEKEVDVSLEMEMAYATPPETIGKPSDPLPKITNTQKALLDLLAQRQSAELETGLVPIGIEEAKPNIFTY